MAISQFKIHSISLHTNPIANTLYPKGNTIATGNTVKKGVTSTGPETRKSRMGGDNIQ
jgi:hypothetical protein